MASQGFLHCEVGTYSEFQTFDKGCKPEKETHKMHKIHRIKSFWGEWTVPAQQFYMDTETSTLCFVVIGWTGGKAWSRNELPPLRV